MNSGNVENETQKIKIKMEINEEIVKELRCTFSQMMDKFLNELPLDEVSIMVLGCTTSEIAGGVIGKASVPIIGEMIVNTMLEKLKPFDINLAVQCCEHLNRALVVEKSTAKENNLEIVTVIPKEKAGGSVAAIAYRLFKQPVVAEFIKADAGIDIGDTFIGMHLKHVAIPIRLDNMNKLGFANVTFAKTRPKYIGGTRAKYE